MRECVNESPVKRMRSSVFIAGMLGATRDSARTTLFVFAPGFYGDVQLGLRNQSVPLIALPTVLVVGEQDCANGAHAQTLPVFRQLGGLKALVSPKGANHCHWTVPVRGQCAFDKCGDLTAEAQQTIGWGLLIDMVTSVPPAKPDKAASWTGFGALLQRNVSSGVWQCLTQDSPANATITTRCPC